MTDFDPFVPSSPAPDEALPDGQEWIWDAPSQRWLIHVEGVIDLSGEGNE